MCSGDKEDHPDPARRQGLPDHRRPRATSRDRRAGRPPSPSFRNVDAPSAAVRPPPSPPWSVYHSLSILPVGAVPPWGPWPFHATGAGARGRGDRLRRRFMSRILFTQGLCGGGGPKSPFRSGPSPTGSMKPAREPV